MKDWIHRHKNHLLIAIIGVAIYWPMSQYFLKWDNLDQFLPFHHFISESFSESGPAFWMPYQFLGYPIYGDPQSGFWYPFTWLGSLLGGYGFLTFNLEVMFHYILAGWGMLSLGRSLKFPENTSFILAICYMCSGFMVGTSHVYPYLIGAAWLPFIISGAIQYKRSQSFVDALKLGFVLSMCVVGSYPAFTIIASYFLVIFFLYWVFSGIGFKKWVRYAVLPLLVVVTLCSGYLYSLAEVIPLIQRSSALPYNEFFHSNAFTIEAWASFLMPYSTASELDHFRSDPSMINGYFGVLMIPFILISLRQLKKPLVWILVSVALFSLLGALGSATPIRYWMYLYIPGFDLFRHPSLLRLYAILAFLILAGIGVRGFLERGRKSDSLILAGTAFLFVILTAVQWGNTSIAELQQVWNFFLSNELHSGLSRASHSVFNLLPSWLLLVLLFYFARLYLNGRIRKKSMVALLSIAVLIEVGWTTRLLIPITVVNNISFEQEREAIDAFPSYPRDQGLDARVGDIDMRSLGGGVVGVWRNLGIWKKRTAMDGYNPYHLSNYDLLKKDSILLDNPVVFSSINQSSLSDLQLDSDVFQVGSNSPEQHTVSLLQNQHPNWRAYVDGTESPITNTRGIPSIEVPSGEHIIRFQFENLPLRLLFFFSMLLWTMSSAFLFLCGRNTRAQG